jgi:hypothetical protein
MGFSSTFRLKMLMKWLADAPFPDYNLLNSLKSIVLKTIMEPTNKSGTQYRIIVL